MTKTQEKYGELLADWLTDIYHENSNPEWQFSFVEKTILENVPNRFNFIIRDKNGNLNLFSATPEKSLVNWMSARDIAVNTDLSMFNHLFKSIKWSDKYPCNFRKYISKGNN